MENEQEDLRCTRCGIELIVVDEPDACMHCGEPLCSFCYDASPYCGRCETEE